MKRPSDRLPPYIPESLRRRVEIDAYALREFVDAASRRVRPGARVLDAGAGEGRFRERFSGASYIGVDLAVGDQSWDYAALDAVSDLESLPFASAAFDAALCIQVLEHVPDPLRVLSELQRALKPGARLFLSVPQSWHQHQKPHDFYRYTSFGLKHLIHAAGLQVESLRPIGGYFWFLSFQLQNINYWLFPRGMRGRRWTWPLRAAFGLVFQLLCPLVLYYADRLDRQKDETLGYLCVALKPKDGA